jgi:hypothetical protein
METTQIPVSRMWRAEKAVTSSPLFGFQTRNRTTTEVSVATTLQSALLSFVTALYHICRCTSEIFNFRYRRRNLRNPRHLRSNVDLPKPYALFPAFIHEQGSTTDANVRGTNSKRAPVEWPITLDILIGFRYRRGMGLFLDFFKPQSHRTRIPRKLSSGTFRDCHNDFVIVLDF